MAHRFTEEQVRGVVHGLDSAGVEVIEVTHGDGLGGSSFNYGFSAVDDVKLVAAAVDEARRAKIAVLLLPGLGTVEDLRMARDAGASVARIATHCTEADVSLQHFAAAREMGMETVGFLMLAHRVGPEELAKQARIMVDGIGSTFAPNFHHAHRHGPDRLLHGSRTSARRQRPASRLHDRYTRRSGYRTSSPVTARPMIIRWISDVPSKMVKILASRCQRSTGYSRV